MLTDFGGLDGLREHLADVKPDRIRNSLAESSELLDRNMKLIILDTKEIEGWHGLETIRRRMPDWEKIRAMAVENNFKSLMGAIDKAMKASRQPSLF